MSDCDGLRCYYNKATRDMTHTEELSPENQLLLCIARRSIDDTTSDKIRALLTLDELDWNYLLTAAVAHGLAALMAHHLQSVGGELIPSPVLAKLKRRSQHYVENYLFLTGQLTKIVTALNDSGIRSVAFKGPTLALVAYGDLALRQFADVDILVHKRDMDRVKETLTKQGFVPFSALDRGREAALLRFDNAYAFANDHGVFVDVHWRFAPLYFSLLPETEGFWERVEPLQIGGQTVMTLSAEDLLLVLCCHGFTHQWERLVWVCDVASLIELRDLDWDFVLQQAKRLGVLRIVLSGLLLARELGAALPPQVSNALEGNRAAKEFAEKIGGQIFELDPDRGRLLQWLRSQLSIRERIRDKARVLLSLSFTPRDYDWRIVSVPPSLSFLYYLIRPIRMARTYGARVLNGNSGKP